MRPLSQQLVQGSQLVSYMLGALVLGLTFFAMGTSMQIGEIGNWLSQVLGFGFMGLLGLLITICLMAWFNIRHAGLNEHKREVWVETGVQAANGVTTLALTYTLYGISIGIGSLATQALTPETVQVVIRDLTANFSLAFMTTVIGLPVSALLRALVLIEYKKGLSGPWKIE